MAFWGLRMMNICFVAVAGVRAEVRRLGIGTGGRSMKLAWTSLSLRSRCHNCPKLRLYISKKELRKREEWFQKVGSYKLDSILSKSSNNAQTQRPCEIEYEAGTTPEIGRAAWKVLDSRSWHSIIPWVMRLACGQCAGRSALLLSSQHQHGRSWPCTIPHLVRREGPRALNSCKKTA